MNKLKKIYIIVSVAILILLTSLWISFKKPEIAKESPIMPQRREEMSISGTIEEVGVSDLMLSYPYPPSKIKKTVLFLIRFLPETKFSKVDKIKNENERPIKKSDLKSGQIVYINYVVIKDDSGNELLAKKVYVINYTPTREK